MNVGRYLRGEDRHVGTARTTQPQPPHRTEPLIGCVNHDCAKCKEEEHMNNETQRLMEALMLIYGSDLQAATVTVLLKDGDTAVRFITLTIPQRET
jgi:hypothetical protein